MSEPVGQQVDHENIEYPFDPETAFQNILQGHQHSRTDGEPSTPNGSADAFSSETSGEIEEPHSTLEPVPQSLLGDSFFLRIDTAPNPEPRPLSEVIEDDPIGEIEPPTSPSHLKRLNSSTRRLLGRKSSLSSTFSRRSSTLRSTLNSRTLSVRSRWSFIPGRDGDVEEGGIRGEPDAEDAGDGEVYEMPTANGSGSALLIHDLRRDLVAHLFGPALNSPQYLPLIRSYINTIDKRLDVAYKVGELEPASPHLYPLPLSFITEHVKYVISNLTPWDTSTTFVLNHTPSLTSLLSGTSPPDPSEKPEVPSYTPTPDERNFQHTHALHTWHLFTLETLFHLPLTPHLESRATPVSARSFCETPIKDLLKTLLPPRPDILTNHTTFTPAELTAGMLTDWKGIHFTWTSDITQHLCYDESEKSVYLYNQVGLVLLHAISGQDTALYRTGFVEYHNLLVEIADTLKLLFGADRRSAECFRNLSRLHSEKSVEEPWDMESFFYDMARLPACDREPRFLYHAGTDFPVFGERLMKLRTLLKPSGLKGMWKDKRDRLQWWTFWAVVGLGGFGILVGVLQLGLAGVQTWLAWKQVEMT